MNFLDGNFQKLQPAQLVGKASENYRTRLGTIDLESPMAAVGVRGASWLLPAPSRNLGLIRVDSADEDGKTDSMYVSPFVFCAVKSELTYRDPNRAFKESEMFKE